MINQIWNCPISMVMLMLCYHLKFKAAKTLPFIL